MKAILLAAGKGVRMWPLAETRPKPLLPVLGKPLLQGTIENLADAGISEITLVFSYKGDEIRQAIGDGHEFGIQIRYVKQQSPKGTADAVWAARKEMENENMFVVVYADNYYAPHAIARFLKTAKRARQDTVVIATAHVEDSSQFGLLTIKKGMVTSILEKQAVEGPGEIIAGLYLLNKSIFQTINKTGKSSRGEFELTDSLQRLIDKGQAKVRPFPLRKGEWQSLSYPWDLLEANHLALDRTRNSQKGRIETRTHVTGKLVAMKGSVVKSGCYLEGPVFIDKDATIGPNAYIRPYTVLGKGVHVGASCEIKNSVLMDKAKVPHLSYIGDSILGQEVSLGAGTVTANLRFDDATVKSMLNGKHIDSGRRKLGAVIGDGVKTGIHVSIMPGVKVGTAAWLGPGIVVREDVPDRARVRQ